MAITLKIQLYCEDCPNFEPDMVKPYDNGALIELHCVREYMCEHLVDYLRANENIVHLVTVDFDKYCDSCRHRHDSSFDWCKFCKPRSTNYGTDKPRSYHKL